MMQVVDNNMIFGLDIGTRSIVGIIGQETISGFHVVASHVELHETRAMIDGQIHDIEQVSKTIIKVKEALEHKINKKLKKACIAAAGRVLKTLNTNVIVDIEDHIEITKEMILSLELQGMERAMHQINYQKDQDEQPFYCVGYSVTNYYLNGFTLNNLEGHKGTSMAADILSTFLPSEVVNSLYKVVERAGLEVYSLTLEPIAAIRVAIPAEYRLLNIALVDIGAGTSDIAITKAGSIIAYGMIPIAGDEITESILHEYLVDFATAEKIKIKASSKSKTISFKDAIGMKQTVNLEHVRITIEKAKENLAQFISDRIKELNGGVSTNAVFIVGGGGQVTGFTDCLARHLEISEKRVALRGKDVLGNVSSQDLDFRKSPEFVTPIGICLTGFANNQHDFVEVYLNDESIRIFNTSRLSVMDVVALKGIDPKTFIAKRGQSLEYTYNQEKKILRGELGEPAHIYINQKEVDLSHPIKMHDYINIIPAVNGKNANQKIKDLLGSNEYITLNGDKKILSIEASVNGTIKNMHQSIENGDEIFCQFPTIQEVLEQFDIDYTSVFINEVAATLDTLVKPTDVIHTFLEDATTKKADANKIAAEIINSQHSIVVIINDKTVKLTGKKEFLFVDIFDFYPFDRSRPKGVLYTSVNKEKVSYMDPIHDGDTIEIYWIETKL